MVVSFESDRRMEGTLSVFVGQSQNLKYEFGEEDVSTVKPTQESHAHDQLVHVGEECMSIPEHFTNTAIKIRRFDMSYNELRSLRGLERFVLLEELILDNNLLDDRVHFPHIHTLHTLSLNKNRMEDLEQLLNKISGSFPCLKFLSLLGNAACPNQLSCTDKDDDDYKRYRYYVLYKMPGLRFLDSSRVTRRERLEAHRVGKYMKVVRPSDCPPNRSIWPDFLYRLAGEDRNKYNPLPITNATNGKHKGAYGVCKFKYLGLQSEGNRFIRNADL